eukprot:1195793-Prorocentrum_minimum.AAC.5
MSLPHRHGGPFRHIGTPSTFKACTFERGRVAENRTSYLSPTATIILRLCNLRSSTTPHLRNPALDSTDPSSIDLASDAEQLASILFRRPRIHATRQVRPTLGPTLGTHQVSIRGTRQASLTLGRSDTGHPPPGQHSRHTPGVCRRTLGRSDTGHLPGQHSRHPPGPTLGPTLGTRQVSILQGIHQVRPTLVGPSDTRHPPARSAFAASARSDTRQVRASGEW